MHRYKGSAYVVVIMLTAVLSIIGLGILSIAVSDYNMAVADNDLHDAYYIADGGATAAFYELRSYLRSIYEEVYLEALLNNDIPIDIYIEQHFYSNIPLSYTRKIDFSDGKDRYSNIKVVFTPSNKTYSIVSEGHVKNAISKINVLLVVNAALGDNTLLSIKSWKEVR